MPVKKTVKKPVAKTHTTHKKATTHTSTKTTTKVSGFEKKLDKLMLTLQKKLTFVKKIMELDFIKTLSSWKVIEDSNKWVKENLEQITKILGRIIIVFGGITILVSLSSMGRLFRYFGGGYTILMLLNIVFLLIGMIMGYGLIQMKKRVPFFTTLTIIFDIVYIVVASIFWGMRAVSSPRTIIFYIIFLIYILKNKALFNK